MRGHVKTADRIARIWPQHRPSSRASMLRKIASPYVRSTQMRVPRASMGNLVYVSRPAHLRHRPRTPIQRRYRTSLSYDAHDFTSSSGSLSTICFSATGFRSCLTASSGLLSLSYQYQLFLGVLLGGGWWKIWSLQQQSFFFLFFVSALYIIWSLF